MKKFTIFVMAIALATGFQKAAQGSDFSDYVLGRSDLVAYYQFEEQSGPAVTNAGGIVAYNGTTDIPLPGDSTSGPVASDGFTGMDASNKAFDFGATANTEVMLTSDLRTAVNRTNLTFSAFIKLNSTSNNSWIFDTGTSIANSMTIHRWNQLLYVGVNGGATKTYNSTPINDLKWHLLTVVRNGTASADVTLYVDGVAITQMAGGGAAHDTGLPAIGALAGGGNYWLNGKLDDVALFSSALSAGEVSKMYRMARKVWDSYNYSDLVSQRSDLIAYYQFDEQSGTAVTNVGGVVAYDGTTDIPLPGNSTNGPVASDGFAKMGASNKAFDFGATASTEVTLTAALGTAVNRTNLTFSAFIKLNSTSNNSWIFDTGPVANSMVILRWGTSLYVGLNAGATIIYGGNLLDDLKWHHLAVVRNGTAAGTDVTLYVDGVARSGTPTGNTTWGTGVPTIGSLAGGSNYHLDGKLDDVALFSTALSAGEVDALYQGARTEWESYAYADAVTSRTDLIAYYQFEEQSGSNVISAGSPVAYDGTTDIPLPGDSTSGPVASDGFTGMGASNKAFDFGATANTEVMLTSDLRTAVNRTNLTFSAFIKLNSTSNNSWIFDTGTSIANSMTIHRWNQLLYVGVNGGATKTYNSTPINDLKWHLLTVVRNGTASADVTLYVDGVAITQMAGGGAAHDTGLPAIGALAGGGNYWLNGKLDDVALFSSALSAGEVDALYRIARPVAGTIIIIK